VTSINPGDEVAYLIGRYRNWPTAEILMRMKIVEKELADPEAAKRNESWGRSVEDQRRVDRLDLEEMRRELESRRR
jgi:hypothetical protein